MKRKIYKTIIYFVVFLGFIIGGMQLLKLQNKENFRDAHGVCIEKFETVKGHRRSTRITSEFIMVVREDSGDVFDLKVTPSTYAVTDIGSRVSFSHIHKQELGEDFTDYSLFVALLFLGAFLQLIFLPAIYYDDK